MSINRYIEVTGQYEGYHKYENAPDEVAFLRNLHRHMFKWSALIEVFHDDRELEFFLVKRLIETKIVAFTSWSTTDLGSCEMQAEKILNGLLAAYGHDRFISVKVSEDGENSGWVEYDPSN